VLKRALFEAVVCQMAVSFLRRAGKSLIPLQEAGFSKEF